MKRQQIITLTTDLGIKDYYTAILKAQLLHIDPSINIIDLSHKVVDFNIGEAAFIFKNAYYHFPEGTIHFVGVNTDRVDFKDFLVFEYQNQFFIGPDNGLFSLVFENVPEQIYRIPISEMDGFFMKDVLKYAVEAIINDTLDSIGTLAQDGFLRRIAFHPVTSNSMIRGTVIHIDAFENVIVNIHQTLFEQLNHDRDFEIYYKRWDPITKLSKNYRDVPVGEVLAFFNSSHYLEIAINMGKAASLLTLEIEDTIQIDFI